MHYNDKGNQRYNSFGRSYSPPSMDITVDNIHNDDNIGFAVNSNDNLTQETYQKENDRDFLDGSYLSIPVLRTERPHSATILHRQISSSPAKTGAQKYEKRFRARRMSQDSGIGTSGQGYGYLETTRNCRNSSDNIRNFVHEPKQLLSKLIKFYSPKIDEGSLEGSSSSERITTIQPISVDSIKIPNFNGNDTQKSPTQAFGPKIANDDIPGTAVQIGLNLEFDPSQMDYTYARPTDSSHSMIIDSQVPQKQMFTEKLDPTLDASANSNYFNNRKAFKQSSAFDDNEERRISKQDKEGLDPESLMFRDGRRKIDMVLAWEEEDEGVMTEAEAKRRDNRRIFMENLIKEGLEVELEDKSQSFNEKTFFLKIHLPWRLETRLAEVMNIKLPVKRFITISAQAWNEENIMAQSIEQWKEMWRRLTKLIELDSAVLEGETTYKGATAGGNPEEQFIVKDRCLSYTSAQRSLMVWQVLLRTRFDESNRMGIRRLLNDRTYLACFPLHEGRYDRAHSSGVTFDRRLLYQTWARASQWYKRQPLCLVRKYFGDKIALYFCWLGFYTEMLIYPAIVGTLCFLYGLASIHSKDNIPSKEICDQSGTGRIILCPLCDTACSYQKLSDSCVFSRLTYLFDNPSTVFFAIFMSFWATTFLELWKRKQSVLIWEWDLSKMEADSETRPEFETNATMYRINPVTREKEPYMSTSSKATKFIITGSAVAFMLCIVLGAVLGTIIYRISLVGVIYGGGGFFVQKHAKLFTTITAALINLVVIMILTKIYHRMALKLTNMENPRTHTEFEDSYTFKIFFFEFMNFYSSLIYIAFFKGRFFDYPGDDVARQSEFFRLKNDICDPAGCLSELCIQLAIIMIGKQCWNNFMEYLFPKMYNWWRQRKHKQATKDVTHLHMAWEQDYHMQDPGRLALFDEYLEMILQYGFVTLFVAAFPLAPLFALLNNVAEIRLDAYKVVTQARRPLAERVEDIGAWYGILRIITYTAVVSNAFVIAYTSDFIPRMVYKFVYSQTNTLTGYIEHSLSVFNTSDYKEEWGATSTEHDPDTCRYRGYRNGPTDQDPYGLSPHYWHVFAARLAFVVIFEHVVFVMTGIMQFIIPDIPAEVKTQIQREQMLAKEAKFNHGLHKAQQGDNQDILNLFRESTAPSGGGSTNTSTAGRGSWARRLSRIGADGLEANIDPSSRARRSMESTVWEVS